MPLVTASSLALQLGVPESNGDLTAVAAAVNSKIKAYLGWDVEVSSYTEYLDGTGAAELVLDSPPVPVSVTTVHEDRNRVFGSDTLLTAGTNYVQRKNGTVGLGVLVRIGAVWPWMSRPSVGRLAAVLAPNQGVVKVVYTTTNTDALAVATMAARMEGKALYDAYTAGGGIGVVTNDGMDGASIGITLRDRPGKRPNSRDNFVSPLVADMLTPWAKIFTPR